MQNDQCPTHEKPQTFCFAEREREKKKTNKKTDDTIEIKQRETPRLRLSRAMSSEQLCLDTRLIHLLSSMSAERPGKWAAGGERSILPIAMDPQTFNSPQRQSFRSYLFFCSFCGGGLGILWWLHITDSITSV